MEEADLNSLYLIVINNWPGDLAVVDKSMDYHGREWKRRGRECRNVWKYVEGSGETLAE